MIPTIIQIGGWALVKKRDLQHLNTMQTRVSSLDVFLDGKRIPNAAEAEFTMEPVKEFVRVKRGRRRYSDMELLTGMKNVLKVKTERRKKK